MKEFGCCGTATMCCGPFLGNLVFCMTGQHMGGYVEPPPIPFQLFRTASQGLPTLQNLPARENSTREESHDGLSASSGMQDDQEVHEETTMMEGEEEGEASENSNPTRDEAAVSAATTVEGGSVLEPEGEVEVEEDASVNNLSTLDEPTVPAASIVDRGDVLLSNDDDDDELEQASEDTHPAMNEPVPAVSIVEGRTTQDEDASSLQWKVSVTAIPFPPPPKASERNSKASIPTFEQVRSHLVNAFRTKAAQKYLQDLTDPATPKSKSSKKNKSNSSKKNKSKSSTENLSTTGEKFADRIGGMRFEVFLGASL
jgi:hypothetical protein